MDFHSPQNVRLVMNVGKVGAILYAVQAEMSAAVGTLIPHPGLLSAFGAGEPGSGLWDTSLYPVSGLSDAVG